MIRKPVRAIVVAIAGAAACWSDAAFPPRVRACRAVSARTGYARPVVDYALDRLFLSLRRDEIEAVIQDELGSLEVLDGFAERPGRPPARALPLGRVCVVSSRTTIGAAIVPAIFALCAKCEVLVKDREDHLVGAFFGSLAEQLGELRDAAVAQTWKSEYGAFDLRGFNCVVAFGSDATLAEIASQLTFSTRFIPYGSRASAGYVGREALQSPAAARAIAARAARDLVLYDSEGCLSLHALFVERGAAVSAASFGEMLADAIGTAVAEFPPGSSGAARTEQLATARDLAMFRMEGSSRVYSDPESTYLVVVDPPVDEPPLFLPRALAIHTVESASEAASYFQRHGIALEAVAVTEPQPDVADMAARTNASRIARFGTLQAPPLGGFHGGRPRIAEFVRWIVDEI